MRFERFILIILVFIGAFIGASQAVAQYKRPPVKNLPYYDQRRLHWGFCLGIDMNDITFVQANPAEGVSNWTAACPQVNPAFIVGLMGDMAITEHLNLRLSPLMRFQQRNITFRSESLVQDEAGIFQSHVLKSEQKLKTTYLELPLSLKISTRRINNYRPYLVAGVQADLDMSHEKKTPIVFNRFDFGLHIGLGCDFYLRYFKFAPELRFNLGLVDMLDHKRKDLEEEPFEMMHYTQSLESARNIGLSMIFWFE